MGEIPAELLDSNGAALKRRAERQKAEDGFWDNRDQGLSFGKGRQTEGSAGAASQEPQGYRPKAIVRPRATAKADKPYIAQGIGSLNQLAGISKGVPHQAPADLAYSVGDRVLHVKYGEGSVLQIEREPRDYKVTVNFDKAGQKIMYASFAKLKRL